MADDPYGLDEPKSRGATAGYVGIGVLLIAVFGGLFYWWGSAEGGEAQALCAVVVDQTSLVGEGDREQFATAFESTVQGCAAAEAELATYRLAMDGTDFERVDVRSLVGDASPVAAAREEQATELAEQANTELTDGLFTADGTRSAGGNLLRGLGEAADYAQDAGDTLGIESIYLVVLSHGWQDAPDASLAPLAEGAEPSELVRRAAEDGFLPDLAGIDVSIIGVGGGVTEDGDPLTTSFVNELRSYWTEVIEAAGGRACHVMAQTPRQLPATSC